MSTKSKFFRVATEGATTDGRTIDRTQIQEMADSFNPAVYGARVWLEHLRGIMPDGPFKAYGDVTAVKAEEVDIEGTKRLALFAQIEPTPEMVAMNKARQKIYTSIEINPKFADTGRAYLVGLGVTDTPASIGTEALTFSAQNPAASIFAHRKLSPENLFSAAVEVELVFEDDAPSTGTKLADAVKSIFSRLTKKSDNDDARFADVSEAVTAVAEQFGQVAQRSDGIDKRLGELETKFTAELAEAAEFRRKIEFTDKNSTHRQPAAGGAGAVQTDF